jgi:hypothetical protein
MPGVACSDGQSCSTAMGCGANRERACFCDPNNQLACETCEVPDAGSTGAGGAGGAGGTGGATDGGAAGACPSGVMSGMACSMQNQFCTATCAGGQRQTCFCTRTGGRDGGSTSWNCLRNCTVP